MVRGLRLMGVFAHPDDEGLVGGTLARYADEGVETVLVCATRGEAGTIQTPGSATPETLAEVRERELRCACEWLGVRHLYILGYPDGGLEGVDGREAVGRIVALIRRHRPHVVVTWAPDGGYGHPDHIAVSRWTRQAVVAAGLPTSYPEQVAQGLLPHAPVRLFYRVLPQSLLEEMPELGERRIELNGRLLGFHFTPDEELQAILDVSAYAEVKAKARACHVTQFPPERRSAPRRLSGWDRECFVLGYGQGPEPGVVWDDLFAGIREQVL